MRTFTRTLMLSFSSVLFISHVACSKEENKTPSNFRGISGWSTAIQGSSVNQFATDLDNGGRYSNAKYNIQASRSYLWDAQSSASLALSYSYADYQFTGNDAQSLAGYSPWNKVHSVSLSTPLRKGMNEQWSGFLLPYVRFTGESGAQFNESLTAGLFAAATYRFSKNLSIGPGLAVTSQLQDSPSIFPLLLIKWNISDKLTFNVGNGKIANQGPGLTLSYQADRKWQYSLGGYYQKLRFRLDENGSTSGGIGEDSGFPLLASATYNINPVSKVTFLVGGNLSSELTVENSDGDEVISDSSDSGVTAGIAFSMRL